MAKIRYGQDPRAFAALATLAAFACVASPNAGARAEEFSDPTCPSATQPTRAFATITHTLPQSLDHLLDASRAVAHEYEICAANYRTLQSLENMNYALVRQARADFWSATIEARYNRREPARHDLARVLQAADIVTGFKDRATNPGPDNNAAGGGAVMDMRHDSVPSRFDGQAKELETQARALLETLASASPAPVPSPADPAAAKSPAP